MTTKAVNRPVNLKAKEADINAKLQLFGIYSAFAQGKAPSNKQIDIALNSFMQSKMLSSPSKKLSPEGHKLVADVRDVIEKAKLLVLTKNDGNLVQDFIWQTQQLSGGDVQKPGAPVDKETAKQHGNEALEGLRTLGKLLITNGQFRKLLNDASILVRDIAGDAATNAASRVNPTEEQLRQIDEPAAENTWHDLPDVQGMKDKYGSKFGSRKEDAKEAADHVAQNAVTEDGRIDPNSGLAAAQRAADSKLSQEDKDKLNEKASETTSKLKEKREKYQAQVKDYLEKKVPKDRRDATVWRLKKMIVEVQGHQDYLQAVETLLSLAETYAGHGKNVAGQSGDAVKGAHTDDSLQMAEADLKTLIERFANSTSLDDLFDSIAQIYRDADNDPELKSWFKHIDTYIRKCLKEQGFIMTDASNEEWNDLYEKGRFLLRERYRSHTDRVVEEIKFVANQFDADPQNKDFGLSVKKLFEDLGNDENGKPTFKPHLVKDLRDVILPALFENVSYIPIPRIEVSDKMMDVVIENLVIESDNLAPNVMEFGSDNYWRWGRKQISNKNKNKLMLSVSGVQMDLRDVSYYIKKKEGFPSITDTGVMDIFLGGTGLSFKIEMETSDDMSKAHYFKVEKVKVDMKNLNIKLKQSKHKLLFSLIKPLLFRVITPAINKVVEKQLKDSANKLDNLAYRINEEAKRAQAELKANPDPENAKNMWQRYAEAGQKVMAEGKQKQERAKQAQVNYAITQHDSIFKDIKLPGGISSKATEYKELADKGEKWESPVFSIGSAKETTSLPRVSAPTRKPHSVTKSPKTTGTETFSKTTNTATNGFYTNGTTTLGPNGTTTLGANNPVIQGTV